MFEHIEGTVASEGENHVGGENDPVCVPAHNDMIGLRVTGIGAGAASVMTVTSVRRCRIQCMSIPEQLGQFFLVTSLKVIDTELMIAGSATSTGGFAASTGVFGSEFASYGSCADLLDGMELDHNSPITIAATNTSLAAGTEFRFAARVVPIAQMSEDNPNCRPKHAAVMGVRVVGVTTGAAIVVTVTSVRRCVINCISVPEQLGQIWLITSFKVIDTELMIAGSATSSLAGTAASTGVFASELTQYGLCASALKGMELQSNSPIIIGATNTSAATQEFRLAIRVDPA